MKVLSTSEEDLSLAAAALKEGKLVAFPTETVYGLGADAFNTKAIARVFEAKRRPTFDPLIIHIAEYDSLHRVADLSAISPEMAEKTKLLAERLWPGPLTLILPKREEVPELVTSGLQTAAIRLPAHAVARRLIELSTGTIAAPSANPFGYLSPTRAEHVVSQLGDRVDFIVGGGKCEVGVESTVLDLSGAVPTILRPGGMPKERIEAVIGEVAVFDRSVAVPTSPGQLPSHYAPRVPLRLYPRGALVSVSPRKGEALLFFDGASRADFLREVSAPEDSLPIIRVLSEEGDTVEAAANLFEVLHELDASGATIIRAERARDGGLGTAVNDRLYKAGRKESGEMLPEE